VEFGETRFEGAILDALVASAAEVLETGATPEITADIQKLWQTWAKSQDLFSQYGTKARSYSGFVTYINEQIAAAKKLGTEEGSNLVIAWQRRLKEAKDSLTWMKKFRGFDDLSPMGGPPVSGWERSEGMQTWLRDQDRMASDFAAIQDAVEVWRVALKEMQANGTLLTLPNTATANALKAWGPDARKLLADVQNMSFYGGLSDLMPGTTFEGAIELVNRIMLDYASFSKFDQAMKSVIPFWMFPSRSMPFWIETLALRPQIASFYAKYMNMSKRFVLQRGGLRGGVTTMGEPLPSLAGYMPIPGTDIWFNPTSALSFRYLLPTYTDRYDEASESTGMFQQVLQGLHNSTRQYGFSVAPWVSWLLYRTGGLDQNLSPEQGWLPQTALIPPTLMRSINRSLNRMNAPFDLPEYWEPQVGWQDFLVERRVLTEANKRIMEGAGTLSAEEKLQIASDAWEALRDREGNTLYDAARDQLDNENWVADVAGYFTGQYGKIFSDADAYLIELRIYNNRLKETINNQVNAQLFGLDPVAEDRYQFYYDNFVPSAEGALSGLMRDISFVTDPEDNPLYGMERRGMLEQEWAIKQIKDAYYLKIEQLAEDRDAALMTLPIGAPSAAISNVWDTYFTELSEAETKYKFPRYPWSPGVHTPKQIEEHFLYEWNTIVKRSEPRWDIEAGEEYLEFTARHDVWLNELPSLTEGILRVMNVSIQNIGLTVEAKTLLFERIREITNKEGVEKYRLENDEVWEAVDAAWLALRWDPYWDALENLGGAARELAQREYLERVGPTLTVDQAYEWITKIYGGRFTRAEIEDNLTGRDQYDITTRQAETEAAKVGEEIATPTQDVWDLLSLASLQGRSTDLRNAFSLAGGDPDLIDVWYTSGGNPNAFQSPEDFIAFRDLLKKAVAGLGLGEPTNTQLEEKALADELDDAFAALVVKELGPAALQLQSIYLNLTSSARKTFREERPLDYATIQAIYDLKDKFAAANELWGKYYWPQGTGGGSGSGGSSDGKSYPVVLYRAPRELYGLNSSDKEKLKLYYEHKGSLKDNYKKRLNEIWVDLGRPNGSLNNWINGDLKRRFTTTTKTKPRGTYANLKSGGGSRGGGYSSGGGGYPSGGGGSGDTGSINLGRRSTLIGSELLAPGKVGSGGYAAPPYLPAAISKSIGKIATKAVESALKSGGKVDKETGDYLKSTIERHPDWEDTLAPVISGYSYLRGGPRLLPN
jgi:curved DNA-binding protein CbpA